MYNTDEFKNHDMVDKNEARFNDSGDFKSICDTLESYRLHKIRPTN